MPKSLFGAEISFRCAGGDVILSLQYPENSPVKRQEFIIPFEEAQDLHCELGNSIDEVIGGKK